MHRQANKRYLSQSLSGNLQDCKICSSRVHLVCSTNSKWKFKFQHLKGLCLKELSLVARPYVNSKSLSGQHCPTTILPSFYSKELKLHGHSIATDDPANYELPLFFVTNFDVQARAGTVLYLGCQKYFTVFDPNHPPIFDRQPECKSVHLVARSKRAALLEDRETIWSRSKRN